MKIAVTGGSGFIGNAVIEMGLLAGHEMLSFDRANGDDILGQLNSLYNFKPDSIIHLAGVLGTHELFDTPAMAIDVNIHGTLRILESCKALGAGYVGITMPPVFPSIYTATKLCTDHLATAYHETYGIPVAKVRAFNAFGPGQKFGPGHPQKIIPTFAVHSWARKPIPIWGDGSQTVDLIDVTQIARILVEATSVQGNVTIDAGSGVSATVNEIAAYVNGVTGSMVGMEYLPMRRGETPTQIVAQGDGWEHISFEPSLNDDFLKQTIWSYQGHPLVGAL